MFLIGREKSDVMKNELDKENQEKYDKLIRIIVLSMFVIGRGKYCDVMKNEPDKENHIILLLYL